MNRNFSNFYIDPRISPEENEACVDCGCARSMVNGELRKLHDVSVELIGWTRDMCALALICNFGKALDAQKVFSWDVNPFYCPKSDEFVEAGLNPFTSVN